MDHVFKALGPDHPDLKKLEELRNYDLQQEIDRRQKVMERLMNTLDQKTRRFLTSKQIGILVIIFLLSGIFFLPLFAVICLAAWAYYHRLEGKFQADERHLHEETTALIGAKVYVFDSENNFRQSVYVNTIRDIYDILSRPLQLRHIPKKYHHLILGC